MTEHRTPDEIGEWFRLTTRYGFQKEVWRHAPSGEVLAIEHRLEPGSRGKWRVITLHENHTENPEPKETLSETASRDEAMAAARQYIRARNG